MTAVTVVIPALNAAATLGRQLDALRAQVDAPPFSVIVVDNGSTDRTADVAMAARAEGLDIAVVHEQRRGVNRARNAGVAAAAPGVVLLCDADDVVDVRWVAELFSAIDDRHWGAGSIDYESVNSRSTLATWGAPSRAVPPVRVPYVDGTFGGNCGFITSMWECIGGFDDRLSGAGDENEFFARAHAAGFRIRVSPEASVGYTLRPGRRAWLRHRYRSGVGHGRAARCAGGRQFADVSRPARSVPALLRVVLSAPLYIWTSRSRLEWAGSVLRQWGRLVGWVTSRSLVDTLRSSDGYPHSEGRLSG